MRPPLSDRDPSPSGRSMTRLRYPSVPRAVLVTQDDTLSRILLVDDDAGIRSVFRTKLQHAGHELDEAESAEAALGKVKSFDPAVVITDVRMEGMTGLELLNRIRASMTGVDVIVMTGHDSMTSAVEAMKSGAFDYLVKPVSLKELEAVVERCLREQDLIRASGEDSKAEPADHVGTDTVVGRDPRMIEIYKMIGVLSRNRATVLVRGETGTGKEMVARAIHDHSHHADEPFIAVNCTALTDTLLESELFGHTRGAFTGAVAPKKGVLRVGRPGDDLLGRDRRYVSRLSGEAPEGPAGTAVLPGRWGTRPAHRGQGSRGHSPTHGRARVGGWVS